MRKILKNRKLFMLIVKMKKSGGKKSFIKIQQETQYVLESCGTL